MIKIAKYLEDPYLRDRLILVSSGVGLLLNILLWVVVISKFGYTQEKLPLHFNIVYGIDLVGAGRNLYQIPGAGLIIFVIDAWLGKAVYRRNPLFSYFLTFAVGFVQVVLLIALFSLVSLNA